ncbi:MAG: glycoside hydrolase family 16 protein [Thermomicrobiales bacterium]
MKPAARCPLWVILVLTVLIGSLVVDPLAEAAGNQGKNRKARKSAESWQLAFSDEFNGSSLDEQTWTSAYPWGRSRKSVGEEQWYAPDAFKVANGKLQISARRTPGAVHNGEEFDYSSGLISSHKSFTTQYGRFEIRCKMPQGQGLWPAFWLLPITEEWPPEIDVFEALGHEPDVVHMHAHWQENGKHRDSGETFQGPDFTKDFHTFAVEWSPEKIVWFVDGVKRHELAGKSPKEPMYLLANMAVGGDYPGSPDASTPFPASFDIDYIRVYESTSAPTLEKGDPDKKKHKDNKKNKRKKQKRKRNRRVGAARRPR